MPTPNRTPRSSAMRPLLLLLVAGLAIACGKRRRPPPATGATVRTVRFEGNGGLLSGRSDFSLRGAMEQEKNPAFVGLVRPRRRRVFLDDDELALDAWRLEVWYAHHGYFDAAFRGWDIQRVRPRKRNRGPWKLPPAVRIVGHIDEGRPYTVDSLRWEGIKSMGGPIAARLKNDAALQEGATFDLDSLNETVDQTRAFLLDQSYAYVTVTPTVDVYPKRGRSVDVVLTVELGPSCTFGEIEIGGLKRVPERIVRQEMPLETPEDGVLGDAFSASDLASTRRRLFGLQVFSVVNVVPELTDPPADPELARAWEPPTVVPVRVELAESSFRQMRLGTGVLLEGGRQEAHVSADFGHVNLFERLIQLTWKNRFGYAVWLSQAELVDEPLGDLPDDRGPIVDSQIELTFPHVPARGWRLVTDLRYELGVEQGYRYSSPSTSPALRWRATDRIDLEFGYHLRFFDYINLTLDEADFGRTPLGLDFSDPYLISYLRQKVVFDSRDDILFARRGLYGSWEFSEAGGPVGGQFNFLRLRADHRAYVPIIRLFGWRPSGALAFRLGGGLIQPYGDEESARVPYAERLYLGGASDVRGWQSNRLGPFICDPAPGQPCTAADVVPIGGLVSLFSSAEVRLYTTSDVGFAIFTDAGMVWEDLESAIPPLVLPSAGAGLRYKLPFGVVRLDVARRLVQPEQFALEPLWNLHFGLSEAY